MSKFTLKFTLKCSYIIYYKRSHSAQHATHTPFLDMLPHNRINKWRRNFTECFNMDTMSIPDDILSFGNLLTLAVYVLSLHIAVYSPKMA